MVFILFGLVKLIFGLPKSEEYLPEGLPGILKFCEPWYFCHHKNDAMLFGNYGKICFCRRTSSELNWKAVELSRFWVMTLNVQSSIYLLSRKSILQMFNQYIESE